jgi:hypothetical protein
MAVKVTTPKFRVSFPTVFEARENPLNGKMEYSIVMLFDKDSVDLSQLKKAAHDVALEKFGDKLPTLKLRSPFRDGDEEKPERPEFKNQIFMTVKSTQRPGVVDEAVQPILDQSQFYAGCYARATISAFAYDRMGNKGVSFGLINLQKMNDGEPLTNRISAEDDFAPIKVDESLAEEQPSQTIGDLF